MIVTNRKETKNTWGGFILPGILVHFSKYLCNKFFIKSSQQLEIFKKINFFYYKFSGN